MIVTLKRPVDDDGVAPWSVADETGRVIDFIDPTPELRRMMEEPRGRFEAVPTASGWDVRRRL